MDSNVRARPSHYSALGLEPSATGEEIEQAFARESGAFRPRPLGGISQLISAYEVLRDSAKRQAYDVSIGVKPQPAQGVSATAAMLRGWAVTARPAPVARPVPAARPDPVPERKAGPVYGAASRSPAAPTAPTPMAKPDLEQSIEAYIARHRATADRSLDAGPLPIEWKRPWLAIGGLLVGVGAVGALAGSWASNDIETDRIGAETLVGPPAAEARPPASVAPPKVAQVTAEPPEPVRVARAAPPPRAKADREPPVEATPPEQSRVEEIAAALTVAETPPPAAAAAAATLPLPNKVVARTIERIGYSCGEVASTTPVEGAGAGVFTVTCTSGQSYQARPVRGRYRFRRTGG